MAAPLGTKTLIEKDMNSTLQISRCTATYLQSYYPSKKDTRGTAEEARKRS